MNREHPSAGYYDDTQVLHDPQCGVGIVLYPDEVDSVRDPAEALDPLINDLGDSSGNAYLTDSRWPLVVEHARVTLTRLRATDDAPRDLTE